MKFEPEISSTSIVLLGTFNPAIFQPAWLLAHQIESPDEEATVNIIHNDISQFEVGQRSYHIEPGRFQIQSQSAPWVLLSDIVGQIFAENLVHTPVRAFGINRHVHFNLPSAEHRLRLGRSLAPIDPWGEFGKQLEADDPDLIGGLQRLVMRRPEQIPEATVHTNVTVEPSAILKSSSGVFMQVNSHHDLRDLPKGHGCEEATSLLAKRFEGVLDEAEAIIVRIMQQGSQ